MTLCKRCEKNEAIWRHKKFKVVKNEFKYLCEQCLMEMPNTAERIDHYDYVGGK